MKLRQVFGAASRFEGCEVEGSVRGEEAARWVHVAVQQGLLLLPLGVNDQRLGGVVYVEVPLRSRVQQLSLLISGSERGVVEVEVEVVRLFLMMI